MTQQSTVTASPVVRTHVPVIFNGSELKDIEHKRRQINVWALVEDWLRPSRIDFSPPYQRDEAWSMKKEEEFIASLFSETMAVPAFYLAKKNNRENCASHYALDCRQRGTAIHNFVSDRFAVPVVFTHEDGQIRKRRMLFSEIVADEDCFAMLETFKGKQLDLVVFEYGDLETQRKIFSALNNGVPLNADEQTYCNSFLARNILEDVFTNVFCSLFDVIQPKVRHRKRFSHVRAAHELLMLCGDQNFRGDPEPRRLRKQDRMNSARLIHNELRDEHKFEYNGRITEAIRKLGIKDRLPPMMHIAGTLAECYRRNSTLGRQYNDIEGKQPKTGDIHVRNVIDPLAFLYKLVVEGKTTIGWLRNNTAQVEKFLDKYYTSKPELSLNQSTSDLKVMRGKFNEMQKCASRYLK